MAFEEGTIYDRMNTAEAKVSTMQQAHDHVKEEYRIARETLGIKGDSSGFKIDFQKLVDNLSDEDAVTLRDVLEQRGLVVVLGEAGAGNAKPESDGAGVDVGKEAHRIAEDPGFVASLGLENAFKLRALIDRAYLISGQPGEKPRIRLPAGGAAA